MTYEIKTVQSLDELKQVYSFAKAVIGQTAAKHMLASYQALFKTMPKLLIYAGRQGCIIGCALGRIERDHVRVGLVAVAERNRNQGVGTALLKELEAQARAAGHTTLILGASQAAEPFYLKCGLLRIYSCRSRSQPNSSNFGRSLAAIVSPGRRKTTTAGASCYCAHHRLTGSCKRATGARSQAARRRPCSSNS